MEVTVLMCDRTLYQRLSTALSPRYLVRAVRSVDDLWAALRERPVALVVVDTGLNSTAHVVGIVRALRTHHPTVPVVAYCHVRRDLARDVFDLVRADVHDLVIAGVDDDRLRLTDLVGWAAQRSVTTDVTACAAAAGVASEALALLRAFLDAAAHPLAVPDVASALGVHRRTLFKRLAVVRLPAPQTLGAWCRLLVAARLLDDSTSTVERVAHTLGFASANALRNLFQRHATLSPTMLRARGGYSHLRDRFVAQVVGAASGDRRTSAEGRARRLTALGHTQGGGST